mmetsp:Transcript_84218/g.265875  ORF Transcript_84218/g.265875 Transcript_84218/m.265875 type:complete len:272 (+) Transcript_84218:1020-1835(+)
MCRAEWHSSALRSHEGTWRLRPLTPRPGALLHLRCLCGCHRACGRQADSHRLRDGVLRALQGGRPHGAGDGQGCGWHRDRAVLRRPVAGLQRHPGHVQGPRALDLRGRLRVLRRSQGHGGRHQGAGRCPGHADRRLRAVGEDDRCRRGRRRSRQRRHARRPRQVVVLPCALPGRRPLAGVRARRGWPELSPFRDVGGRGLCGGRDVADHGGEEARDPRVVHRVHRSAAESEGRAAPEAGRRRRECLVDQRGVAPGGRLGRGGRNAPHEGLP